MELWKMYIEKACISGFSGGDMGKLTKYDSLPRQATILTDANIETTLEVSCLIKLNNR